MIPTAKDGKICIHTCSDGDRIYVSKEHDPPVCSEAVTGPTVSPTAKDVETAKEIDESIVCEAAHEHNRPAIRHRIVAALAAKEIEVLEWALGGCEPFTGDQHRIADRLADLRASAERTKGE